MQKRLLKWTRGQLLKNSDKKVSNIKKDRKVS